MSLDKIPSEIWNAIISAAVALIVVGIPLFVSREKLKLEIKTLEAQAKQADAETTKIQMEPILAERAELKRLLTYFEREAFQQRPSYEKNPGDPKDILKGVTETRVALQKEGASIKNKGNEVYADLFKIIQDKLRTIEIDVEIKYPDMEHMDESDPLYWEAAGFIREQAYAASGAAEHIREHLRTL